MKYRTELINRRGTEGRKIFITIFRIIFILLFAINAVVVAKEVTSTRSKLVQSSNVEELSRTALQIGTNHLDVEVAADSVARDRGLMYRKMLQPDSGMLFVFPAPQQVSFWMKDTTLLLSVAYISPTGKIMEIHDLEPMNKNPIQSSSSIICYALEVTRGWFFQHGILPGDMVTGLPAFSIAR